MAATVTRQGPYATFGIEFIQVYACGLSISWDKPAFSRSRARASFTPHHNFRSWAGAASFENRLRIQAVVTLSTTEIIVARFIDFLSISAIESTFVILDSNTTEQPPWKGEPSLESCWISNESVSWMGDFG